MWEVALSLAPLVVLSPSANARVLPSQFPPNNWKQEAHLTYLQPPTCARGTTEVRRAARGERRVPGEARRDSGRIRVGLRHGYNAASLAASRSSTWAAPIHVAARS